MTPDTRTHATGQTHDDGGKGTNCARRTGESHSAMEQRFSPLSSAWPAAKLWCLIASHPVYYGPFVATVAGVVCDVSEPRRQGVLALGRDSAYERGPVDAARDASARTRHGAQMLRNETCGVVIWQ